MGDGEGADPVGLPLLQVAVEVVEGHDLGCLYVPHDRYHPDIRADANRLPEVVVGGEVLVRPHVGGDVGLLGDPGLVGAHPRRLPSSPLEGPLMNLESAFISGSGR